MKKILSIIALSFALIFIFNGCALFNQTDNDTAENKDRTIRLDSYNIKDIDFESLYYDIVDNLYYEGEKIYIPDMYIIPFEMQLDRDGNITQFRFSIYQILDEDPYNYTVENYWILFDTSLLSPNSESDWNIYLDSRGTEKFSKSFKGAFGNLYSNYNFKKYMLWLNTIDFEQILDMVDSPYLDFITLTRDHLELSIFENADANFKYLNPTENGLKPAENLEVINELMADPNNRRPDTLNGEYYDIHTIMNCIVKPYYLKTDGVTGFDEKTLGQIDKKTVVSNNVLIII